MHIDQIRAQFPALQRTHNGHPVVYFDAPGGTQVPRVVAEAMSDYLFHHNANTHWVYPTSEETDAIITTAREAMADLLGAQAREIAFGANMTTLTFHLARTLGRMWSSGDEVIVTELDHHANVAPWRALQVDRGIEIRSAKLNCDAAQLDYDHLASLVTPRTKLIAVGGASNAIGTINDLRRVAEIAKAANALLFVDAVHLVPHELVDVRDLGCDFLACSSYKFYGPHEGILWGRFELLDTLPFPKLAPAPDTAPERVETGTQNHEGIAGITATVNFLASLMEDRQSCLSEPAETGEIACPPRRERLARTFTALHEEGQRFASMMWEAFTAMPRLRVYGPPPTERRTPTMAFTVEGMHADDAARALAKEGLFVSSGDFYAATVCERYAIDSLVRIGCACYTSEEEVRRLIDAVGRLQ
jgi:cysteine desulfurase family protein (TIGR01976 family)